MMNPRALLLGFFLLIGSAAYALPPLDDSLAVGETDPEAPLLPAQRLGGFEGMTIRLMPAFYWETLGLEFEAYFGDKVSLGLNVLGTLGRTDGQNANFQLNPEDYLEPGFRAELAFKYYPKGRAPEGIYGQVNVAYSQIVYYDGNTRPYTFHNRWRDQTGVVATEDLVRPNPLSVGLGFGYQVKIIPDWLVGNIMLGIQGQMDQDNQPFVSIYLSPSLGIYLQN